MDAWLKTYARLRKALKTIGTKRPFFRGHADATWKLLPTLARLRQAKPHLETNLYFDFLMRGGNLLPAPDDAWNNLFMMQHHGVPTRLLDWSETFGVALYFALKQPADEACIWILNPAELNRLTRNRKALIDTTELGGSYDDFFVHRRERFDPAVVALSAPRHHPRVAQQRGCFTLHNDLTTPLDGLYPNVVIPVPVPSAAYEGGREFLRLSGLSEYTLFPDLDGLAREMKTYYDCQ